MADGAGRTGCVCNGRGRCGHGCLRFVVGAFDRACAPAGRWTPAEREQPADDAVAASTHHGTNVARRSTRQRTGRRGPLSAWSIRMPGAARERARGRVAARLRKIIASAAT
ncbi:hypothetical protein F7R13_07360 [Burkholderia territorii]|uniref:Uncharacterized protein n=1 Tax=Burkholderia territorii TaxID=1503055 RepID=A0A6L3NMN0_9BURK|nr:hypothetical protein F7R13_07360 [Burkholderia territorii]